MMNVGQVAQQILALEPQKSTARLAFYHYIKNFYNLDAGFKQEMIDQFYDRALSYQYWQTNKDELGKTIAEDLKVIQTRSKLGFDIEQIIHSHDLQILSLDHARDFLALVNRDLKKYEVPGQHHRLFHLNADQPNSHPEIMILKLLKTGQVNVEIRSNVAALVDGELVLLRPISRLCYTAELDIEPNVDQVLYTSTMRVCRFEVAGHRVKGSFMQGPTFHRAEHFDKPLEKVPELFHAIKKLERFYVNPVTDPYYEQMLQNFGQVIHEREI